MIPENQENLEYPLDFFLFYFTDEVIQEIANQSALYSIQVKPEKPSKITTTDVKKFLAVSMYMSLVKLSYTRNYWSADFRIPQVADTMTLNRYEELKRFLHFADNMSETGDDRITKIRPLVEKLRKRYKKVQMEEHIIVDEQIVPFKAQRSPSNGVISCGSYAEPVVTRTIWRYTHESLTMWLWTEKWTAELAAMWWFALQGQCQR